MDDIREAYRGLPSESLGKNLKIMIQGLRWTQEEASQFLVINASTLRRWLNGSVRVPFGSYELVRREYQEKVSKKGIDHGEQDI